MSIYSDMQDLEKMINDCADPETGEIKQSDDEAYQALREELAVNGLEKLAKVRANLSATMSGIEEEINRMAHRHEMLNKRIAWLEDYMLRIYLESPKDKTLKIQAGTFTIGTRSSTRCIIDDETIIPPPFLKRKETVTVDKETIKRNLLNGMTVPGAHLQNVQHIKIS